MSELTNEINRHAIRRLLLSTVSSLALIAGTFDTVHAEDNDGDHPTVWIELGAQLDHIGGEGDNFPVGFIAPNPNSPVLKPISPFEAQNPPPLAFGEEGKITFQPEDTNWVLSAAVHVGRSSNNREVDHQTNKAHYAKYHNGVVPPSGMNIVGYDNFADTRSNRHESHLVADFSAGKDVGLGLFGKTGSSVLSFGVRFAQFSSKATFDVRARPDLHTKYATNHTAFTFTLTKPLFHFHTYHNIGTAGRSFHGIGPSLSWSGSAPVLGHVQSGEVTFDLGANAAVLFGRQRAHAQHHESGHYVSTLAHLQHPGSQYVLVYQNSGGHSSTRMVAVPNVGGFASVAWRIEDFKINLGYRADFFFGAMDGGIDKRRSETLGFYGPFASVSLGMGG